MTGIDIIIMRSYLAKPNRIDKKPTGKYNYAKN
jgi:hypothetical protein